MKGSLADGTLCILVHSYNQDTSHKHPAVPTPLRGRPGVDLYPPPPAPFSQNCYHQSLAPHSPIPSCTTSCTPLLPDCLCSFPRLPPFNTYLVQPFSSKLIPFLIIASLLLLLLLLLPLAIRCCRCCCLLPHQHLQLLWEGHEILPHCCHGWEGVGTERRH